MKSFDEMTWKEHKIDYIEWFFKEDYERWSQMDVHDDRRLYVNVYDQIMEAINQLPDEPVAFICVAMNDHIKQDLEIMRRIQNRFEELEGR